MQPTSFLTLAFAALAAAAPPLNDVLKTNSDSLSTLNSLLAKVPVLNQTLIKAKEITILAPSNDAFAKMMQMDPTFAQKATNVTFLTDLLSYHVASGKTTAAMFYDQPKFAQTLLQTPTANVTGNQKVELVRKGDQGRVFSGYKQMSVINKADVAFQNGVLHIIDTVLTVPGSPADTAMNTGLTSMAGALVKAGLVDGINSLQVATIFAPTNAAFQAIGATAASMEPADLARILQYHVLTNQVRFTTGVTTKMGYKSLMGEKVTLRKEDTTVFANSAKVTIKDIITSDGVMHVVDSVLNPASPKLAPGTSTAAFPGAVQAANAPFTDGVKPTANFTPAGSSSKSFDVSLKFAMFGFLGCLAMVYL
ncbi:fasciclin domain-containing protein [Colletotrichum orchidophilum]|uniref:Fasciclin domain-containing protein n=1 Tax=Colletotrichum orchidophilum TaxID=1209926 RepID=A0A1G4BPJ7_9PEZI|nr:fasciclin domain-containing protein [Colletotrichum orchidophilum]OHF03223.1 fasciclin domain-containing protein [Colletotrichum orchidophilum]